MNTNIPFQNKQPIFGKVGNIAELVHMTAEERKKYNVSIGERLPFVFGLITFYFLFLINNVLRVNILVRYYSI